MTERGRGSLQRDADQLSIGPSSLRWERDGLTIRVDERSAPLPRAIRGTIRVEPIAINETPFVLDANGGHVWHPIAPSAHITVDLEAPLLQWQGTGYFDMNHGNESLEDGFTNWTWSRSDLRDETVVFYDAQRRDGSSCELALRFDAAAGVTFFDAPPKAALPSTLWRVARETRCEEGRALVRRTYEDTPFYARSLVESTLFGQRTASMHESLSLERFANPIVRCMLPFRMPRRR